MTEVAFSSSFKRAFKKRIKGNGNLETRFWERLEIFVNNPFDQSLRTQQAIRKTERPLELFN
jgi:mRNA-degrading endonuclease YafQ of YafQ-DinJ toxin-antitoxin module